MHEQGIQQHNTRMNFDNDKILDDGAEYDNYDDPKHHQVDVFFHGSFVKVIICIRSQKTIKGRKQTKSIHQKQDNIKKRTSQLVMHHMADGSEYRTDTKEQYKPSHLTCIGKFMRT